MEPVFLEQHIQLCTQCIICFCTVQEGDSVAAVAGDCAKYRACTLPFEFPAHRPQYCTVYVGDRSYQPRLCRYPQCERCSHSFESFIFHLDCFNVLSRDTKTTNIPTLLSQIWQLGSWSRAWIKAPFIEATNTFEIASFGPLSRMTDLCFVADLPAEIQRMIVEMSREAPLWRWILALECKRRLDTLDCDTTTQSIIRAERWSRFGEFAGLDISSKEGFITIGFDRFGLRIIESSDTWPSAAKEHVGGCDWYMVEEKCRLLDLSLESKGRYRRLKFSETKMHQQPLLWDTPTPPKLDHCRFFNIDEVPYPVLGADIPGPTENTHRLRTITLGADLTGLTFFCCAGLIYGIHAHRARDEHTALKAYNKFPQRRRESLLWIFLPLQREAIEEVWVRHGVTGPGPLASPILMTKTTRGKLLQFGHYQNARNDQYYAVKHLGSSPSALIYQEPPQGGAILSFGVAMPKVPSPKRVETPRFAQVASPPFHTSGFYCSSASLSNVETVMTFHDREAVGSPCLGILLTYCPGHQQALGQCRLDADTHKILSPTAFHYKSNIKDGLSRVDVQFSTIPFECLAAEEWIGWESTKMERTLIWWFDDYSAFCSLI
ncbi:hypothetical protein BDZ45DRAFT_754479 [Acephala macrosclerotiorum]|nr:hypothetical protein BDZ45DRAFT_754479 [Acephala macrosclerotiorum]